MSDHTPAHLDIKPGAFVSWVMPILLIIACIGLLTFIVSKDQGHESETHVEKTHAEA